MRVSTGLLLVLIFITLGACETPRVGTPHHVIGSTLKTDNPSPPAAPPTCNSASPQSELCALANTNKEELAWYQEHEWPYHRTDTKKPPLICVAISTASRT